MNEQGLDFLGTTKHSQKPDPHPVADDFTNRGRRRNPRPRSNERRGGNPRPRSNERRRRNPRPRSNERCGGNPRPRCHQREQARFTVLIRHGLQILSVRLSEARAATSQTYNHRRVCRQPAFSGVDKASQWMNNVGTSKNAPQPCRPDMAHMVPCSHTHSKTLCYFTTICRHTQCSWTQIGY